MANQSITQPPLKSQVTVTLESSKVLEVPDGANPEAFRRWAQAREDRRNHPPKKTKSSRIYRSRRQWRASQILSTQAFRQCDTRITATATLVERANSEEADDTETILASAIGLKESQLSVLEVAR